LLKLLDEFNHWGMTTLQNTKLCMGERPGLIVTPMHDFGGHELIERKHALPFSSYNKERSPNMGYYTL